MSTTYKNPLYLIDANILIHAHDLYYNINRVPEFWSWIEFHAQNQSIAIPSEIHGEIKGGKNALHAQWVARRDIRDAIILKENFDPILLQEVINTGYAPDLSDAELESIGMDPFLIAYGLQDVAGRVIVSNEISKPSKQRSNRKIPDVCSQLGIRCCNIYELLKLLDFRTNWNGTP